MKTIFSFVASSTKYSLFEKTYYFLFVLASLIGFGLFFFSIIIFVTHLSDLPPEFYHQITLVGVATHLNAAGYWGLALIGLVLVTGQYIRGTFVGPYLKYKYGSSVGKSKLKTLYKLAEQARKSVPKILWPGYRKQK